MKIILWIKLVKEIRFVSMNNFYSPLTQRSSVNSRARAAAPWSPIKVLQFRVTRRRPPIISKWGCRYLRDSAQAALCLCMAWCYKANQKPQCYQVWPKIYIWLGIVRRIHSYFHLDDIGHVLCSSPCDITACEIYSPDDWRILHTLANHWNIKQTQTVKKNTMYKYSAT